MRDLGLIIAYRNAARAVDLQQTVWKQTGLQIEVVDNTDQNQNIHKLWNQSYRAAERYFLILNPDTKPERGWLDELMRVMSVHPRMAAVGPSTDHCYNEQSGRQPHVMAIARGSFVPQVLIPGFCALYYVPALREIGGWREDFKFYGGDLDLVLRLHLAGWLSAWAVSSFVWHEWGGSARALGDAAYAELRETGNRELQEAVRSYQDRPGLWVAQPGGGAQWRDFNGQAVVQVQGEEDATRGSSEREAPQQEAAGTLWVDRVGEATP